MIRHYHAIRNGFSLCLNTLSFAPHVVLRLILVRSSALHAVRQSLKTLLIYLLTFQTLRVLEILHRCLLLILEQFRIQTIRRF